LRASLFNKNAFQNVIVNGIVLAEDGKKMSKKLKNYPDPMEIVDKYGADALRYYVLSSPVVQAENLSFSEKGVDDVVKKNIGRLANVLAFYQLYADGTPRDWKSERILDRWILARLDELIKETTAGFEKYQLDTATRPLSQFIDDLSVWYLRRSRERFKGDVDEKKNALATLRYVLHRLSLVMAPSMPFFAEYLFLAIREEEDEESVHLATWPEGKATAGFLQRFLRRGSSDATVLDAMEVARRVVSEALELREKAGIKVRQPLATLSIPNEQSLSSDYLSIIAQEVNVKNIEMGTKLNLNTTITPALKEEGVLRDAFRLIQDARKAQKMRPGEHGTVSITVLGEDRAVVERHLDELQKDTNSTIVLT
jgi:isoleucyl-tRNA synthetase